MADPSQNLTVECFLTDPAFVNQTKSINGIYLPGNGQVGTLTQKSLSYFNTPALFTDGRDAASRQVNWVSHTKPQLVVDQTVFTTFTNAVNGLSTQSLIGFFKIVDRLLLFYSSTQTHDVTEAFLLADNDIKTIYVPGSFDVSTTLLTDTVYLTGTSTAQVTVPAYAEFQVTLPIGSTATVFMLKIFASNDAWIDQYNYSSIVSVIPPLPYNTLFSASLLNTTANVFSTSSLTATLSYNTTQTLLGSVSVSGVAEYRAVVTDGVNNTIAPFNILYKGREPTLFEIRNAIKAELLASGVGTQDTWKARIPGVFVEGRFYIVPLWNKTYTKPDQILFPTIATYQSYLSTTENILATLGYGDLSYIMDVLSAYYNKMTVTAVPDISGTINIHHLSTLIPDYQDYSPSDDQFTQMLTVTQSFSRNLNTILSIDTTNQLSDIYPVTKEGSLSFYSFTVNSYEFCVLTKLCYQTQVENSQ